MSDDLRAAVEGLPPAHFAKVIQRGQLEPRPDDHLLRCEVLALIPEGAVLVTEETLAAAIRARYVGEVPDDEWDAEFNWHRDEVDPEKCRAAVRGYMRRLREGT